MWQVPHILIKLCSCHGVGTLLFVFLTSAVSNKMFERIKGLFWSLFGDSTNRSYTDGDQAAVTLAVTVDFLNYNA